MVRIVSLSILTTLIIFLGITFFRVIAPYLLPLFLAGVTAVLCQPIYAHFRRRTRDSRRISAALTTLCVLAVFLVPLLTGTFIASVQLFALAQEAVDQQAWKSLFAELRAASDQWAEFARQTWGVQWDTELFWREMQAGLRASLAELAQRTWGIAGVTLGVLGRALGLLISLLIFAVGLYYFLADGPALLSAAERLIPVHVEYQRQMLAQFEKVVRSIVMATFLAAIVQGSLTAAALWMCGFRHVFVFLIVATLTSMVPLAGAWVVWGPCAVWLATHGAWGAAAGLTLFGALVIGTVDNVVRTYVLHSDTRLHPLLALVSVLGGLQAMGLWGVFIGPIVACCLHALVKIFNTELKALSEERFLWARGSAPRLQGPHAGDRQPVPAPASAPSVAEPSPAAPEPPASPAAAAPPPRQQTRGRKRSRRARRRK